MLPTQVFAVPNAEIFQMVPLSRLEEHSVSWQCFQALEFDRTDDTSRLEFRLAWRVTGDLFSLETSNVPCFRHLRIRRALFDEEPSGVQSGELRQEAGICSKIDKNKTAFALATPDYTDISKPNMWLARDGSG
jgi:hypothetical protein